MSTVEEDNYFGKFLHDGPAPGRIELKMAGQLQQIWRMVSAGLAAVWAEQNTREAIFDAMARREVYATTGSRIRVRVFGGWDFNENALQQSDWAEQGYQQGVPMGGVLPPTSGPNATPTLMVKTQKDPNAAHLDRVQIVKGWLDSDGNLHEKFMTWPPGKRSRQGQAGLFEPVPDTTDLTRGTYSNAFGAAQLEGLWRDPDFDASQPAFYYVRVLKFHPRWTTYDAVRFGEHRAAEDEGKLQERAYTSAIWYYRPMQGNEQTCQQAGSARAQQKYTF